MPVALKPPSAVPPVAGVRVGAAPAGIRRGGGDDLALFALEPGTTTAAVFTRNVFCAAPVHIARDHLSRSMPRFLLINAGNANAGTGSVGLADAVACCAAVAEAGACASEEVLPFSTGVIGERLPTDRIRDAVPAALASLRADGWVDAARAIMTTDTVPKASSRRVSVDGETVTVTGIAKGAGMIRPDMATMLACIGTDASVDPRPLRACLEEAVEASFNRITVDGDTSTNDACVLFATAQAQAAPVREVTDEHYGVIRRAVTEVCTELAQAIVRDGEGATRFLTVCVEAGAHERECLAVAYTIAHSPLVKTAFFGQDPNWGRILAAIGRSPVDELRLEGVDIDLDELALVRGGEPASDYTEEAGLGVMRREEITLRVRLGRGDASARIWTTDLSLDYVRINAEYRT